ncbi:hypothetical protein MUK42_26087 [Musa troglodytarum]|uniref:Uncharacterized protein n=1 Tax=Musa troglodytarum TaxID=320322 RepID=A0A9E7EBI5_9LILI|nr:hypothetical protein MUK42_26087 [Musa troglodytarum]
MGDSVSRNHNVDQPRRRSSRLKHIRVIYEENGVEVISLSAATEKHKKECDPAVGKQVKFMMLESEDDGFTCKSSDHVDTLSDEQSAVGITLKDLRKRCKARKRKAPKCNFSSEVDSGCYSTSGESKMRNHEHVKLEQEESDLEEPLIKLKRLKGSTLDKKRPKRAHLCSDGLVSKKVDTLPPCRFCDPVQDLSPVVKANASTKGQVSEDGATEVDVKNTAGTHYMEVSNSLVSSDASVNGDLLCTGIPEFVHHVKGEIVDICSLDYQIEDVHAVKGTQSANLFQKDTEDSEASSLSISKLKNNIVKTEKSEDDALTHKHTCALGNSTISFIAKPVCPGQPSSGENGELSPASKDPVCCVREISINYREPENYAGVPEIGEEQIGGTKDLSAIPSWNVILSVSEESKHVRVPLNGLKHVRVPLSGSSPNSISAPADNYHVNNWRNKKRSILPEEITDKSTEKQINCSAKCHSYEPTEAKVICAVDMVNEDTQDLANGTPLQEMPVYGQANDVIDEHYLLCKEVFGLDEIFLSGKEDHSCDDLIHDVMAGSMLCSLPLSKTCFSAAKELQHCSEETDPFCKLENASNGQAGKAIDFSGKISNFTNSDGLTELDPQSRKASPLCISSNDGLQCTDDLLKDTEDLSCVVEEKLDATSDQPTITAISHSAVISKEQSECDQELLAVHPPEKLLSYRKTMSPTSQEKLCQALRDIDLQDVSQPTEKSLAKRKRLSCEKWIKARISSSVLGPKDAKQCLGPEQTNKKPRNQSNGPPPPVKKVIVKSPETSGRMPCSCMKTSSIHMNMEKAIEFSQRQMHDIERLAMQLLKGLNSMKNIMEETLGSEAHSSLLSEFTAEEMRASAENASELEKTTKKWLSIMTKDCNRFCKIMRSADSKSAASVNGVRKGRKITFADEVGGTLCHVETFERQPSPDSTPEREQSG